MADTDHAEFPDYEHPLRTPDPDAQAAVVARIKLAMKTGERRPKDSGQGWRTDEDGRRVYVLGGGAWDGSIMPRSTRYVHKPMGERPRLTQADIGEAWGVGQPTASDYINHPDKLGVIRAFELCHALGVTLDWLRYGGANAYGKYEDNPQVVAKLYERLTPYDKEHVCYMLMTLIGEDAAAEVYRAEYEAYMDEWRAARPDEARKIDESREKAMRAITENLSTFAQFTRQMGNNPVMQKTLQAMGHLTTGAELLAQQATQHMGAIAEQVARAAKERADEHPDPPTAGPANVDGA